MGDVEQGSHHPPEQPQVQDTLALRLGVIFAEAREAAGLSVDDVAAKLRISPRQVRALESDDIAGLPGPTFVRGFIRNYAKLLKLDPAPLLEAYRRIVPAAPRQAIALHSENIAIVGRDRKAWLPYVAAAALLGLALGGWMAYMDYQARSQVRPVQAATAPTSGSPEPEVSPAAVASVLNDRTPPPEPAHPPENPEAAPAEAQAEVQQAPTLARLKLTFSEAVWVRVVDRDGTEIFNKTKPAGSEELVEGLPPLQLVIGNAAGLRLSYNDKDVDLVPHTRANVARLTLE